MLTTGCGPGEISGAGAGAGGSGGGGTGGFAGCDVDSSRDIDSAYAYDTTTGATNVDTICPTNDDDYWKLTTTTPTMLVTLGVLFDELSNVRLAAEWFGPKGVCVNAPATTCTATTDCTGTDICDLIRGKCRSAVETPCAGTAGCGASESCETGRISLATSFEDVQGGARHQLLASFPAVEVGDYYGRVYSTAPIADPDTNYELTLTAIPDPDTHEPNNWINLAAELTSGAITDAYLAYAGDADWYHVSTTGFTSEPIITVDLRWPASSDVVPTWYLCRPNGGQPDCNTGAPRADRQGPGSAAVDVRSARMIGETGAEVYVRVAREQAGLGGDYDLDTPYTLTVTVEEDPAEMSLSSRNDTPDTAMPADLNSGAFGHVDSIVSTDDRDWYHITRPSSVPAGDNSLVLLTASAAPVLEAGFAMKFDVYVANIPAVACDRDNMGPAPTVSLQDGTVLTLLYGWPYRDTPVIGPQGEGSEKCGGHSPNFLQVMLPMYDRDYYLLVSHIPGTSALSSECFNYTPLPGYSPAGLTCDASGTQDGCYVLDIEHFDEPDSRDRTDPDNCFESYPLRKTFDGRAYWDRSHFHTATRTVAGGNYSTDPGAASSGFAAVTPLQAVAVDDPATADPDCVTINFDGYGGKGSATSKSISALSVSAGRFVNSCADNATLPATRPDLVLPVSVPGSGVDYEVPAAAGVVRVDATVDGVQIQSLFEVIPLAGSASPTISFGNFPHGFIVDGVSTEFDLVVPSAGPVVNLQAISSTGANTVIACSGVADGDPCPGTGTTCRSALAPVSPGYSCAVGTDGGATYALLINADVAGPVTVIATSASLVEGRETGTAYDGASLWTGGNPDSGAMMGSGYISYAGDSDFFRLPLSSFPQGINMTIRFAQGASTVDTRIIAKRGSKGVSVTVRGDQESDDWDGCECNPQFSPCTSRGFCSSGAVNKKVGTQGDAPKCSWVTAGGDVDIWVNDLLFNDWDITSNGRYEFEIWLGEGCSPLCSTYICTH